MSLLFFSVVFALPGFTGGNDDPAANDAVEIAAKVSETPPARRAMTPEASTAVRIGAPRRERAAARPERRATVAAREVAVDQPSFDPGVRDLNPPPPPPAAVTPTTPGPPAIGDGVRDVGDAVTATVNGAGAAAAPLLGPPVSQAIQDVLDLLSSVLEGATGALGGALDNALPRRAG